MKTFLQRKWKKFTRINRQERVGASFCMTGTGPLHTILDDYHSLPYGLLWQIKNYGVEYKKQAESIRIKFILMRVPIENGSGF